jgi:hypothetical protein
MRRLHLCVLFGACSQLALGSDTEPALASDSPIAAQIAADERALRESGDDSFTAFQRGILARVHFARDGVTFARRGEDGASLRLAASHFGRLDSLVPVAAVAPQRSGGAAVYARPGSGYSEWYRSTERGIEQGFTIEQRPPGEGPLELRFTVRGAGGESLALLATGEALRVVAGDATRLELAALHAFDRDRAPLASWFATHGDESFSIVVDDAGAEYPLTIDPLALAPEFEQLGEVVQGQLGIAVANAGDVDGDGFSDLLIAATNFSGGLLDEGKVYLHRGTPNGLAAAPSFEASGGQAGAYFGRAIAGVGDVDGDGFCDVLIGSQFHDDDQVDEGRVFLHRGSAGGLLVAPTVTIDGNQDGARLGATLAAAGDVDGDGRSDVLIGSPQFDPLPGTVDAGRVYLHLGTAGGIATTPARVLDGAAAGDLFGLALAGAGDLDADGYGDVAIGAPFASVGKPGEGVMTMHRGGPGGLGAVAAAMRVGDQPGAAFGWALAAAGDVGGDGYSDLLVGAPLFDNGDVDEGRAFLYRGDASGLALAAATTSESDQFGARHGSSVTSAGDIDGDGFADVAVGATSFDSSVADQGRVVIQRGSAVGLSSLFSQTFYGPIAGGQFGQSLAGAGDVDGDGFSDLAIGAPFHDGSLAEQGRVVVLHGGPALPSTSFQWAIKGQQAKAECGRAVAMLGDVDGDGYSDVAFGMPAFDAANLNEGKVAIHFGSATGLSAVAGQHLLGGKTGLRSGASLAGGGDIDGDGHADLLIGASGFDASTPDVGRVAFHRGTPLGVDGVASIALEGEQTDAEFGASIAIAGDVDGDGFLDVLIGAPRYSGALQHAGAVFLHRGGASGLSQSFSWLRLAQGSAEGYGRSLAGIGDADGDGFADVAIGAPQSNSALGRIEVFRGSASGLGSDPALELAGEIVGEGFGIAVASAGDVDGDGAPDLAAGSNLRVRIHHGVTASPLGVAAQATTILQDGGPGSRFGSVLAGAGDIDRNGYDDLLIGAPNDVMGQPSEGAVYLFLGSAAGLSALPSWQAEGNQAEAAFGTALAGGFDVDGDGFPDIAIGAPGGENGVELEGRAFLHYGGGLTGRGIATRLVRSDEAAPIVPGARSFASSFRVESLLRGPFGRERVALEIETAPLGGPFDGAGLEVGSVVDTGVGGTVAAVSTGALLSDRYRARARLRHATTTLPFQPTSPWTSPLGRGAGGEVRVAPAAAVLAVRPVAPIEVEHVLGGASPAAAEIEVENLGSGALAFTAFADPVVPWMSILPPSGAGLVAGATPTSVFLEFAPQALLEGSYETTVTIRNTDLPADEIVVEVKLDVVKLSFLAGQVLRGAVAPGQAAECDFDALKGEKLILDFEPVAAKYALRVAAIDGAGHSVAKDDVTLATGKTVRAILALPKSARYTLRFTGKQGAAGSFEVATKAKLPKSAKKRTAKLEVKGGGLAGVKLLALPGTVVRWMLEGKLSPSLELGVKTPEGNQLEYTSLLPDAEDIVAPISLFGLLLEENGAYRFEVGHSGATSGKIVTTVTLEPESPIGSGFVDLP